MIRTYLLQLDAAARNPHGWRTYKTQLQTRIVEALRLIKRPRSPDSLEAAAIAEARMVHDLLYVADRIRRDAVRRRVKAPMELLRAAEEVLSKANLHSMDAKHRRSSEEERYAVGARVNWHKLIKRTGEARPASKADDFSVDALVARTHEPLIATLEGKLQSQDADVDDVMRLIRDLRAIQEARRFIAAG